jgi:anti-sigma B factor antagonist
VLPRLSPTPSPSSAPVVPDGPRGGLLAVSIDWAQGLVLLAGELDRESAHHLLDALETLSGTEHRTWGVDASQVTFCDAGGLRALAAAQALATRHGRELLVVAASRCVERLLILTGLEGLLGGNAARRSVPPVTWLAPRDRRQGGRGRPVRPGRRRLTD